MKRVLLLGLGYLSNGEITIAIETLKNVPPKEIDLLFLSHENGAKYIESLGIPARSLASNDPKENKKYFDQLLDDYKPDVIICADSYTMDYASPWSGFDFTYLRTLGIPIGSFDQYEWESTGFIWDFMGAQPLNIKKTLITECDFLIRPCPLNKPRKFDGRIFTCRLFKEVQERVAISRTSWRELLGISPEQKVIFIVNSNWEYVEITKSFYVKEFIKWMPHILYQHFIAIGEPLTIIHVGPRAWEFPIADRITYKYYPKLDANLYRAGIQYADLFCGTNAISITLSNAIYFGTPAILFQNYKRLDFGLLEKILPQMPDWYQKMAQEVKQAPTFRIFPWGWSRFLEPVFANNPYQETFVVAPVLEPQKCGQLLRKYLFEETAIDRLRQKQQQYFEGLKELEPIEQLFEYLGR